MSEYWFYLTFFACIVALSVVLTLLFELFKHLRYKHLQKQRKAEYERIKRLQHKQMLNRKYAEFVAVYEAYCRKD